MINKIRKAPRGGEKHLISSGNFYGCFSPYSCFYSNFFLSTTRSHFFLLIPHILPSYSFSRTPSTPALPVILTFSSPSGTFWVNHGREKVNLVNAQTYDEFLKCSLSVIERLFRQGYIHSSRFHPKISPLHPPKKTNRPKS